MPRPCPNHFPKFLAHEFIPNHIIRVQYAQACARNWSEQGSASAWELNLGYQLCLAIGVTGNEINIQSKYFRKYFSQELNLTLLKLHTSLYVFNSICNCFFKFFHLLFTICTLRCRNNHVSFLHARIKILETFEKKIQFFMIQT